MAVVVHKQTGTPPPKRWCTVPLKSNASHFTSNRLTAQQQQQQKFRVDHAATRFNLPPPARSNYEKLRSGLGAV